RNHSFTYEMPSDFVGLLDWKIELVKSSTGEPIRSADFGQTLFRRLGKKKLIRVLQVIPYPTDQIGDSIQNSLNLSQNEKWKELIGKVPDYQFEFTAMSTADFNNDNKRPELNGNFDMVILGFADAYFNKYDLTEKSAQAIVSFVDTGQGLMLTHDTISYEHKPNGNLAKFLGPLSGQLANSLTLGSGWSTNQSKRVYQMNEALITNYPFDLSINTDENNLVPIRRTHKQWTQLNLEDEDIIPWYTMTPNTVTTSGSIEDYVGQPTTGADYEDNSRDKYDTSKINRYDARNNYYTYSYKNITFSGTGENSREINTQYPESEMQLFVNTIVRAERAMNHAPTFTTQNIPQEIGYSNSQNDGELIMLDFSVIPRDIDRDMMSVQAILKDHNGNELASATQNNILDNQIVNFKELGVSNKVLKNLEDKELTLTITVVDEHGASTTQDFKIKVVDKVILAIRLNPDQAGYLVGDTVTINPTAVSQGGSGNSERFKNVKTSIVDGYQNPPLQQSSEKAETQTISAEHDSTNLIPLLQANLAYKFKVLPEETLTVTEPKNFELKLTYDYESKGSDIYQTTTGVEVITPIALKRSKVIFKVVTHNGKPLAHTLISFNGNNYLTNQAGVIEVSDVATGTYQPQLILADYDLIQSQLQHVQADGKVTEPVALPEAGITVNFDDNQPIVTYTVKQKNPVAEGTTIEIGLENNQFQLGTNTPTLTTNSYATIGSTFTLVGQP
ncbi:MAG: DUF5057 domain-containing protein, partial [Culicoidibacterales bacterium]